MSRFRASHDANVAASNQGRFNMALGLVKERVFSPYFTKYDAEAFLNENIAGLAAIKEVLRSNSRIIRVSMMHQNRSMFRIVNTKKLKQTARLIGIEVSRKATRNISEEDAACIVYATTMQELR